MNIEEAITHLQQGDIVALPTETVYGLAADALNEAAVQKVFQIKGRPLIDPLIIHVPSLDKLCKIAESNEVVEQLAHAFWPGALTLILPKKKHVPDLITAGLPTVAVRSPQHPVMRAILEQSGLFLAAPSANPFGYISPTRAAHVISSFNNTVPVVDAGPSDLGLESTILDISNPNKPRILRPGPIGAKAISEVLGISVEEPYLVHKDDKQGAQAPGLLAKHYSPKTKLVLVDKGSPVSTGGKTVFIHLQRPDTPVNNTDSLTHLWLSEDGDLKTVAHNLFDVLRKVDAQDYDTIVIERAPNEGIGKAINNRLERAGV